MLEKLQEDNFIELEVERLKLLFRKNKYNKEQKKWFLEAKLMNKETKNDQRYLKVCKILLEDIKNDTE